MKKIILARANDLARDFLYYDRKEDEELLRGEIQKAVERGEVTKEEIVAEFRKQLDDWW
jgi:hypothetical protein